MNKSIELSRLLFVVALFGLTFSGCNQRAVDNTETGTTETTLVAQNDKGCCGKCSTEPTGQAKAEGCCGKCATEVNVATDASKACPSCKETDNQTAVSTEAGCKNGCNACAEGDSANCKCEEGDSNEPANTEISVDKQDAHVNSMPEDRELFHFLLENHDKITRTVSELENGVETLTESTDAEIADKIQEHVASMYQRVEDGRPLRMWDELYREIFKHADKIEMEIRNTENGISVTETSNDEYVVKLIQAHAKVVTGFTKRGFDEARENHEPPQSK